jgi:SAM-dependent methyltransferase
VLEVLLALEDDIISILDESPADQYSIYRKLGNVKMSEILRIIAELQRRKIICSVKHRKNERTGLMVQIYSLSYKSASKPNRLDLNGLLAGVTSERLVEYNFLKRNLVSPNIEAKILDIGFADSNLTKTIGKFGYMSWNVFGIDIRKVEEKSTCISLAAMDARRLGFRDRVFDQIICISTIEHIGVPSRAYNISKSDELGDMKTISEIHRVLKKGGTVVVTLPYSSTIKKQEYRIYDKFSLDNLTKMFSVKRKEFYRLDKGKWKKCSESVADKVNNILRIPSYFHSDVCACLLLKKN